MKISLVSVGTRMPSWVEEGVAEYSKRLPADFALSLVEVPLAKRGKGLDIDQAIRKESEALLAKIKPTDHVIALEVEGRTLSTEAMARRVDAIRMEGRNMVLLAGGPDGLGDACLKRADEQWSLSALTLPHPLVRIVVAEQIYRIWSVLNAHPYHRA
ncbi:MAG: 23S rRNA (pseudouridine(1915)-N(3))-methyltransferase RlmH [Gammaproteobacteria bacterium]|nr:23S rRNA (pseudouridine(1915)-N(3))-methyltransferase RlmH [Gammaproteobacteria bacterium]MDP2141937.1 23S rRNA (pseudouridine(1915)-N(3))-methyltransferase RlmH [Gammaproteobacteria bacterium]MDP2347181.1 23S rRNA (pseudouridine(1915)-N(3))-methyltransferase RlmH [Gammaproteobacteria bacterium]